MLLFITDIAAGSDMKGMNAVMAAVVAAAVMDSASGHNRHIRTIFHIEIIVYFIGHPRCINDHRNMDKLTIRISADDHINSELVLFTLNLNMFRIPMTKRIAIVSQVKGTLLLKSNTINFVKDSLCDCINFCHNTLPFVFL